MLPVSRVFKGVAMQRAEATLFTREQSVESLLLGEHCSLAVMSL